MSYCPSCKIDYPPGKKFCKNCGSALVEQPAPSPPGAFHPPPPPDPSPRGYGTRTGMPPPGSGYAPPPFQAQPVADKKGVGHYLKVIVIVVVVGVASYWVYDNYIREDEPQVIYAPPVTSDEFFESMDNFFGSGEGDTYSGELGPGDRTLSSGEYFDTYYIQAQAGQTIQAALTSSSFDTYLFLENPNGESAGYNDDYNDSSSESRLVVTADVGGEWQVVVTSYSAGETGAYDLMVAATGGTSEANELLPTGDSQTYFGILGSGDQRLPDGEYYDTYYVQAQSGQRIEASLVSSDFDTYVSILSPSGSSEAYNDDFEGSSSQSFIELVADESGEWRIMVTSYAGGETGEYSVTITVGGR